MDLFCPVIIVGLTIFSPCKRDVCLCSVVTRCLPILLKCFFLYYTSYCVCVFIVLLFVFNILFLLLFIINLVFILLKRIKVSLDTKCKASVPTSTVHQAVDERKHRAVVHGGVSCLRHGHLLLTDANKGNFWKYCLDLDLGHHSFILHQN